MDMLGGKIEEALGRRESRTKSKSPFAESDARPFFLRMTEAPPMPGQEEMDQIVPPDQPPDASALGDTEPNPDGEGSGDDEEPEEEARRALFNVLSELIDMGGIGRNEVEIRAYVGEHQEEIGDDQMAVLDDVIDMLVMDAAIVRDPESFDPPQSDASAEKKEWSGRVNPVNSNGSLARPSELHPAVGAQLSTGGGGGFLLAGAKSELSTKILEGADPMSLIVPDEPQMSSVADDASMIVDALEMAIQSVQMGDYNVEVLEALGNALGHIEDEELLDEANDLMREMGQQGGLDNERALDVMSRVLELVTQKLDAGNEDVGMDQDLPDRLAPDPESPTDLALESVQQLAEEGGVTTASVAVRVSFAKKDEANAARGALLQYQGVQSVELTGDGSLVVFTNDDDPEKAQARVEAILRNSRLQEPEVPAVSASTSAPAPAPGAPPAIESFHKRLDEAGEEPVWHRYSGPDTASDDQITQMGSGMSGASEDDEGSGDAHFMRLLRRVWENIRHEVRGGAGRRHMKTDQIKQSVMDNLWQASEGLGASRGEIEEFEELPNHEQQRLLSIAFPDDGVEEEEVPTFPEAPPAPESTDLPSDDEYLQAWWQNNSDENTDALIWSMDAPEDEQQMQELQASLEDAESRGVIQSWEVGPVPRGDVEPESQVPSPLPPPPSDVGPYPDAAVPTVTEERDLTPDEMAFLMEPEAGAPAQTDEMPDGEVSAADNKVFVTFPEDSQLDEREQFTEWLQQEVDGLLVSGWAPYDDTEVDVEDESLDDTGAQGYPNADQDVDEERLLGEADDVDDPDKYAWEALNWLQSAIVDYAAADDGDSEGAYEDPEAIRALLGDHWLAGLQGDKLSAVLDALERQGHGAVKKAVASLRKSYHISEGDYETRRAAAGRGSRFRGPAKSNTGRGPRNPACRQKPGAPKSAAEFRGDDLDEGDVDPMMNAGFFNLPKEPFSKWAVKPTRKFPPKKKSSLADPKAGTGKKSSGPPSDPMMRGGVWPAVREADDVESDLVSEPAFEFNITMKKLPDAGSNKNWDVMVNGVKVGAATGRHDYVKAKPTDRLRTKLAWRYSFSLDKSALEKLYGRALTTVGFKDLSAFDLRSAGHVRDVLKNRLEWMSVPEQSVDEDAEYTPDEERVQRHQIKHFTKGAGKGSKFDWGASTGPALTPELQQMVSDYKSALGSGNMELAGRIKGELEFELQTAGIDPKTVLGEGVEEAYVPSKHVRLAGRVYEMSKRMAQAKKAGDNDKARNLSDHVETLLNQAEALGLRAAVERARREGLEDGGMSPYSFKEEDAVAAVQYVTLTFRDEQSAIDAMTKIPDASRSGTLSVKVPTRSGESQYDAGERLRKQFKGVAVVEKSQEWEDLG